MSIPVRAGLSRTEVSVAGVRSPVLRAGPTDATEAVVFVHGVPGPSTDWTDLVGRVGQFARALAPDMPGFGRADKPRHFSYTIEGYASHLGGVIDQLGVTRAHIVAHDFGGFWALAWAVRHPEVFRSATLINTGALIDYRWHWLARVWRTPLVGELFAATPTRSGTRILLGRVNPRLSRDALDRLYDGTRGWPTRRAVLELYRATPASMLSDPAPALGDLDRPALVIWGNRDAYIPLEQAARQRRSFPAARVETLDGAAHWVMVEDPERLASLVVPFLRGQVGAST